VENLKITIIQTEIIQHNVDKNIKHLESLIKTNNPVSDLLILPEMFNTGFSMNPEELCETMSGVTITFLKKLASGMNADITGSIIIKENNLYFNRLVWIKPDGELLTYDKRHLFRMGGESKVYTPGSSPLTVNLKGWRIRPFICYDLRFPVWTRNSGMEYDLALYTANWPEARISHWETLLRARAIENQCYVAGVNRTGHDGNSNNYNGKSSVIDYYGNSVFSAGSSECIKTVELSYHDLSAYRNSFPAWMDSDSFKLL